jgi:predicted transcriptional regulator
MFDAPAASAPHTVQPSIAAEVRDMRMLMHDLPLTELSRLVGRAPSLLCDWERGRRPLSPKTQRHIRRIVRGRFGQHVARVISTARRHGVVAAS